MKKILIKILPLFFIAIVSCEQDDMTEGVSRITYYNDIELIGDDIIVINQGETYVEPGVTAFEAEEDVTAKVIYSGTVDSSTIGYYQLVYNIINKDGFGKTITRNVLVVPTNVSSIDYSGTYTGVVSTGSHTGATTITKLADGVFESSDFFGGRYNIGFGYGIAYRLKTYFYVSADDTTYTALRTDSPWGPWDVLNPTLSGTQFSHTAQQGTFGFPVVLNKE